MTQARLWYLFSCFHLVATDHSQTASAYLDAGIALLKSGAALVAYDTLAEGLKPEEILDHFLR